MELYLLALLGVIIHVVLKWRDSWSKKEKYDLKKHLVFSLLSFPLLCVLIYLREYVEAFVQQNMNYKLVVNPLITFFAGYFLDSVVKNVEAIGRKTLNFNR